MASKSNVYPPLEKWQRNALSHPNQVPRLPTFVIEDMPVDEAQSIKGFYNSRGWEHCQNSTCSRSGTEYKLMKCAACGPIPGRHALYCVGAFTSSASLLTRHRVGGANDSSGLNIGRIVVTVCYASLKMQLKHHFGWD